MSETTTVRRRGIPRSNTPEPVVETPAVEEETTSEPEKKTLRRRAPAAATAGSGLSGGWDAYGSVKSTVKGDATTLKVTDEPILIKFVEEGPFVSFRQHWFNGRAKGKKMGFPCVSDEDCRICNELGDLPALKVGFNVIDFSELKPVVKIWQASKGVAEQIRKKTLEKKSDPINREDIYFVVSRLMTAPYTSFIETVKSRDLSEDYDLEPLTSEQLAKLGKGAFDAGWVRFPSDEEVNDLILERSTEE